jgi:DNA repair protein RadA/Sms
VEDPAADLALVVALLSSYEDVPVPLHTCFAGEVGLNGEIRAVNRIEQRIAEAARLGFEKILISRFNTKSIPKNAGLEVISVGKIEDVYRSVF